MVPISQGDGRSHHAFNGVPGASSDVRDNKLNQELLSKIFLRGFAKGDVPYVLLWI